MAPRHTGARCACAARYGWASAALSLRWLALRVLCVLSVLSVLPGVAAAQNLIHAVRVAAESTAELTLEVDYSYSGDHGPTMFISALAQAGDAASKTGFRAGAAQTGRHTTRVVLVAPVDDDWYTTNEVLVQMYSGGGAPITSKRFGFAKTWSRPTAAMPLALRVLATRPTPSPGQAGMAEPVQRRFGADGAVEIVYGDGSLKRKYKGGYTLVRPDGREQTVLFATLQPPTPPTAPPDNEHARWLDFESQQLLSLIRTLVGQNEATVSNYLAKEPIGLSPYARISVRREAVERMVTP